MASYSGTTTLRELGLGSSGSIADWATQRQDYKNQATQNSNASLTGQMESDSDIFLNKSLTASNESSAKMNSAACNLNDLAVAMDKRRFQNRGVHIDKKKYPTANAIAQQRIRTFPNDETHVNNCINGKTDLPTTLQRLGIILTDEDRQMLEEKNQMSMANGRELTYNPAWSTKSILTPQSDEANDNALGHLEPTKWEDVETKYANSDHPYVEAFVDNFGKSFYNLVSDISDIVINPLDTIGAAVQTAAGGVNNLLTLDDHIDNMPNSAIKEFLLEANEMADGAGDYLLERFWGTDENGKINNVAEGLVNLGNTFYQDPVGFLSDVFDAVEGGAGITKRGLKKIKNIKGASGLEKGIETVDKIQKTAGAASPTSAIIHPINTFNKVKDELKSLRDSAKNTRIGQQVMKYADKAKETIFKSKKMENLKKLADTPAGRTILPEASEIYKNLAPMSDADIAKFESTYGIKHGDYLNSKGVKGTPQEIIDQLQYENEKLYNDVTKGISEIEEPIKVSGDNKSYMESMLQHNIQHLRSTLPEDVFYRSPEVQEMVQALIKLKDTGEISGMDYLFNKRYFERKTKFSNISPDRVELATNIDNAIREVGLERAEKNGFTNLKEINNTIRKNRSIIDGMGKKATKSAGYTNGIELSDILLAVASYDHRVLDRKLLLGLIDSKPFKEWQLKRGNAIRGINSEGFPSVDMDAIRKTNADNRVNNFYNMSMGDGTPRLNESVAGGVTATDNSDWIKMRAADLPKATDLVIEQYAKTPWDVEKNVVEWMPTSNKVKGKINGQDWRQDTIFNSVME